MFPKIFSISRNPAETLAALRSLKEVGFSDPGRAKRIEIHMHEVEEISLTTAVVLCAEMDRLMFVNPMRPRLIAHRLPEWDVKVAAQLDDLRFFDFFGLRATVIWPDSAYEQGFSILPVIACKTVEPRRISRLIERLHDVAEFFEHSPLIYDAIVEATLNTNEHAYEAKKWEFRPVMGTWWVAGSYDTSALEVRIVAYDQGIGIPNHLPRSGIWEFARGALSQLRSMDLPGLNDDAYMIEAALEGSRSSRDQGLGRGKGLMDIVGVVDDFENARVRILSGAGGILYTKDGIQRRWSLPQHVGGTLIEWSLPTMSLAPEGS